METHECKKCGEQVVLACFDLDECEYYKGRNTMLQELITINSTPAVVTVNFDELKTALAKELERYEILVTAETLADAKKLAQELNKTKTIIDTRRKEEVAAASEPVKKFDADMKELVQMCVSGRQAILDQVKRFEDETKVLVAKLLSGSRDFLFDKHGVLPEFMRAEFDDLIKLTSITSTGKLSKAAKDDLTYRVLDDKRIQDRTEMRLLKLENQSYQAGLDAPLTRDHVRSFLNSEDEFYQSEIDRIIAAELDRQKQAEIKVRQRMEAEQQREAAEQARKDQAVERQRLLAEQAQQQAEIEKVEVMEPEIVLAPEAVPVSKPEPKLKEQQPTTTGNNCIVTCTFAVSVADSVPNSALEAELRKVMEKAGIKGLSSVSFERMAKKEAA